MGFWATARDARYRALLGMVACALAAGCGEDRGGDDSGSGDGDSTGANGCVSGTELCGAPGDCSDDPTTHSGEATYYNEANGSGNCSFDPTPDDLMIGAMNDADYAGSAACGACVRLTGPDGEITIRIVDRCPGCPQGDIDLSPMAFSKIAALEKGRVPITWQYTACDVDGPVRYHWKEGSHQWWTAVQIRNHRYPIASVEYKADDGTFRSVARESYNYFVESAGMGPGPHTLRVTDVYGQVLEDSGLALVEATDATGASQFPACGK